MLCVAARRKARGHRRLDIRKLLQSQVHPVWPVCHSMNTTAFQHQNLAKEIILILFNESAESF